MSEMHPSSLPSDAAAGPLWHAGLASLIAQATLAAFPTMVVRDALLAHLYEGSLKEIGWAYVTPEPFTPAWFGDLVIGYGWSFLCVLPGALLFMILAKRLERGRPSTGLGFGIAGAISTIPLAIGLCVLVARTMHPVQPPPSVAANILFYFLIAAVPCMIGLAGGIVAARFRPSRGWSDLL